MDWITQTIAIGNYLDAQDAALLTRERIRSALSLDGTLNASMAENLGLKQIVCVPLKDGPGNKPIAFRRAIKWVSDLVETFPPLLVQCHAGRSRSPVIVAGHLMQTQALSAEAAIARVAEQREIAITSCLVDLLACVEE